jgi:predicted dehydrogenase
MADHRRTLVLLGAAVAASAFAWMCRKRSRRSLSTPAALPVRRARVAVVGCGGWTQGWHLPNLANRDDVEIVALVEPSDEPGTGGCMAGRCEPMRALVDKYGTRRYRSLDALLDDKQEELDGILIAAPHALHCSLGLAVLRAGLHLLLEKPMTSDLKEARALFDASAAAPGLAFILNNTANWQPGCVQARTMVAAGRLGTVRAVSCVFAAPLGWLFEGEEHVGWSKPIGSMLGNGFGWGQLSHTFAWVRGRK